MFDGQQVGWDPRLLLEIRDHEIVSDAGEEFTIEEAEMLIRQLGRALSEARQRAELRILG